ncbi:FAD-binding domain-containing protein [Mycena pura]|uniref:FAD-binding domain-containing protein n=1 Tax=Mycena pura TaxID=153505 RepID=A0AAD6URL1_9AGAR|nr:FAD-binding domain-containing protein [Mycena pura]
MLLIVLNALLALACLVTAYAQDDVAANSAASVNLPPSDPASLACSTIKLSLGLSIVESSGPEYNATVQGPWSLFNSVDRPTCIVYPRAASHVQVAMARIFEFSSRYAVQAGAHSAMVGYNTVTDGVLISFAHMNSTTYNPVTDTITVQPGVHWGDAMNAVESFGVSVLAVERGTDIGTGLLLGGGISLVSPMFGWSADSVKEMDVVLVTGQLVTASATNQHADLFRALKGGANRFGIYPGSSSVALSNASARYIRNVTDPRAGLIVLLNTVNLTAPDANVVYLFYNGASLPTSIFGEFLSIPSTSQTLSPLSYYDISFLRPGNGRGNGNQFGATAWVGAEASFLNGYNHLVNFTQTFESKLLMSTLSISPIPRSQWTATRSGPNAIGGDPGVNYAAINYHLVYPTGVTTRPADVDAGFRFLLSQTPPSAGLPLYINECDASQNIYRTYAEFETLKSTYSKYDPLRFNVRHTVGPIGL